MPVSLHAPSPRRGPVVAIAMLAWTVALVPPVALAQPGATARTAATARGSDDSPEDRRPVLHRQRGRVFAYGLPAGWRASETTNGIELVAPDGVTGVTASFVLGMFGVQSPEGHFSQVLGTIPLANVRIVSQRPTPPAPGPFGLQWRGVEIEFDATSQGRPVRVRAVSQVLQGNGQYSALLTGIQGPAAQWTSLAHWLPWVRDSIAVSDPGFASGTMTRGLPKGHRHDDVYGRYNAGWTARGVAAERISAAQREGTMGYTRQRDPVTGRVYDMPLGAYDATRGGYVNPLRPTELLEDTRE